MPYEYLLGIGSNIEPRLDYLQKAYRHLETLAIGELNSSKIYESLPLGVANQTFLNGAIRGIFDMAPIHMLREIHNIEKKLHRQRVQKWGNRTIDIDILMARDHQGRYIHWQDLSLTIPHPEMINRDFVLKPAGDIAGDWLHMGKTISLLSNQYHQGAFIKEEVFASSLC